MTRYGPYNLHGYIGWIVHDDNGSTHTEYEHRLVMEAHIGRQLLSDEIVHHLDHDKSNNSLENLSILPKDEHARIHASEIPAEWARLICHQCGNEFVRLKAQVAHCLRQGKTGPYCGKICAGRVNQKLRRSSPPGYGGGRKPAKVIPAVEALALKDEGLSTSEIARRLEVPRGTLTDFFKKHLPAKKD